MMAVLGELMGPVVATAVEMVQLSGPGLSTAAKSAPMLSLCRGSCIFAAASPREACCRRCCKPACVSSCARAAMLAVAAADMLFGCMLPLLLPLGEGCDAGSCVFLGLAFSPWDTWGAMLDSLLPPKNRGSMSFCPRSPSCAQWRQSYWHASLVCRQRGVPVVAFLPGSCSHLCRCCCKKRLKAILR